MSTQIKLHAIQAGILKVLLFKTEARFSELNPGKVSSDHFNFHVKKLLELALMEKNENGRYRLTKKGKEFANRFDVDSQKMTIERQAKIGVLVIPVKEEKGEKKYLIQQRLKQPYYGFYGFLTGKIKWGETVPEAAARELKEETGLEADLELIYIRHKMDYETDGSLLEDKFFFGHRAVNCSGDLKENFDGGRNAWLTEQEILELPNRFDGVEESLKMTENRKLAFVEKKYSVKGY